MLTTDNDKKHNHRDVEPLAIVLEEQFWDDTAAAIKQCYDVGVAIHDTKYRLKNCITKEVKAELRKLRDDYYKQFKGFDYDVRSEAYRALTVEQREAIPWSIWMSGYDPFEF